MSLSQSERSFEKLPDLQQLDDPGDKTQVSEAGSLVYPGDDTVLSNWSARFFPSSRG